MKPSRCNFWVAATLAVVSVLNFIGGFAALLIGVFNVPHDKWHLAVSTVFLLISMASNCLAHGYLDRASKLRKVGQ